MKFGAFVGRLFSAYCLVLFAILALIALTVNLFVPRLRARRWVAGTLSRAFFRLAGIPLRVEGLELLPKAPCVVVANHASYIDGIVVAAALPPDFAFVIKKEMVRVPLASLLLRRLGSAFVERFDRHKGGADTRRVWKLAARGQSLVFFPEGTFDARRQVRRFLGGAFATAQRSNMPVVAAAIHGTRDVLPSGGIMVYRRAVHFEILEVLGAGEARERSRQLIAEAVGEPLAP
ncbi:MAG: lysophospholipid acyltransferase family protein [Steroidobacteraceae bacterium]